MATSRLRLRPLALGLAVVAVGAVAACGSSSEPGAEPSSESLIKTLCEKMAALPCARPNEKALCLERRAVDQADALQEGCEAELYEYLKCASDLPLECGGTLEEAPYPQVNEACGELGVAFGTCYSRIPPNCGVGVGMGTCSITCPELSSACQGPDPNGPVECECDSGPRAGTKFSATDCGKNLIWATGHQCQ